MDMHCPKCSKKMVFGYIQCGNLKMRWYEDNPDVLSTLLPYRRDRGKLVVKLPLEPHTIINSVPSYNCTSCKFLITLYD